MAMADEMRDALQEAFTAERLEIRDDSERHRGHAGWREGGETHWHVTIFAPEFADLGRLERHRAVHAALGPDLIGRIHALQIKAGAEAGDIPQRRRSRPRTS